MYSKAISNHPWFTAWVTAGACVISSILYTTSVYWYNRYRIHRWLNTRPRIDINVCDSICDRLGNPIVFAYSSINATCEAIIPSTGVPRLVFGVSGTGTTSCINSVASDFNHLENPDGGYMIVVRMSDCTTESVEDFIWNSVLKQIPQSKIVGCFTTDDFTMTEAKLKRNWIMMLLDYWAAMDKPVVMVIDDAQKLHHDDLYLGFLLERVLDNKLRLTFVTSDGDSNPSFLISSGYRVRIEIRRFSFPVELVEETLRSKSSFTAGQLDMIKASVGMSYMQDIVSICTDLFERCTASPTDEAVSAAILIRAAMTKLAFDNDAVSDADIREFLDMITDSYDTTPSIMEHYAANPARLSLMYKIAESLRKANIVSTISGSCKYIWRTMSFKHAYDVNISPQ
jgi:hypothetical protein